MTQAYNFCAETHLGGGDTSAFVSPWPPLLERSLRLPVAVPFLGKAHEDSDHTAVIAGLRVKRGTWNGMERGMEWNVEWNMEWNVERM